MKKTKHVIAVHLDIQSQSGDEADFEKHCWGGTCAVFQCM